MHHNLNEFDAITPRFLFEQYEIYLKVNGLEKYDKTDKKLDSKRDKTNKKSIPVTTVEHLF